MRTDGLLRPVGPQPARVYWLRRAVLLAVLVVVIILLARACAGAGGGPSRAGGSGRTAATGSPTPTPSPTGSARARLTACTPHQLRVVAATDATTYAAGVDPRLSVTVRTTGGSPCRLDVAPSSRVWQITSGSDVVWTTAKCGPVTHARYRLRPKHPLSYSTIWNQRRSVDGCGSAGAAAAPGTYVLHVSVDGRNSPPVVFHLTG